jgi:hypothetical protein
VYLSFSLTNVSLLLALSPTYTHRQHIKQGRFPFPLYSKTLSPGPPLQGRDWGRGSAFGGVGVLSLPHNTTCHITQFVSLYLASNIQSERLGEMVMR